MTVGFDRFLRLAWLDTALQLAAADIGTDAARAQLEDVLQPEIGGKRSQVETARLLQQIWLAPDRAVQPSRDHALSLYREGQDPLVLHWGMTMAVYPFFATVAETVGRQLRLHGSFSLPTVLQRVEERYGARPTVQRAARRAVQSVVEWGTLFRRADGSYVGGPKRRIVAPTTAWTVATTLLSSGATAAPIDKLHDAPALFPFELSPLHALPSTNLYDVIRQGGGMEVAAL